MKRILAVAAGLLFGASVYANNECNDEVCVVNQWKEFVCAKSDNAKQCSENISQIIKASHYQGALALYCKEKKESGDLEKDHELASKCEISERFLVDTTQ